MIEIFGELGDLLATLLGKGGRLYNAHGKRICFVIWIVALVYWTGRNISLGLKVQSVGCLTSIAMHVYSFLMWKRKGIGSESKPDKRIK
jgi:hypothetical protein